MSKAYVVFDGDQPIFCAGWAEACHEHINDAINEFDIEGAAKWRVVEMASAAPSAPVEQAAPMQQYTKLATRCQMLEDMVKELNAKLVAQAAPVTVPSEVLQRHINRLDDAGLTSFGGELRHLLSAAPSADAQDAKRLTVSEGGVDWLGLSLDLEQQAKRTESKSAMRVMNAAAHGLRLMGAASVSKDAARYRWLRARQWNDSDLCVVTNPKEAVKLGHDCPSLERLDETIDAALSAQKEGE